MAISLNPSVKKPASKGKNVKNYAGAGGVTRDKKEGKK
jgi:hypothetical protein